jgi:lipoyl(octanoyl) transferase
MQLIDLGLAPYKEVLAIQLAAVDRIVDGYDHEERCFLVEHHPVVTLGKRGGKQYLSVGESFLQKKNIDIVSTGRGGFITYHAPGQLVAYPLLRLKSYGLSVHAYVRLLEEVMISTAAHFNVTTDRDERNAGIWCAGKKLGSIGIAVRHGVTYHGLALNVDLDLEPFSWLNPCGLFGVSMTSLAEQKNTHIDVGDVKLCLWETMQNLLNGRPR